MLKRCARLRQAAECRGPTQMSTAQVNERIRALRQLACAKTAPRSGSDCLDLASVDILASKSDSLAAKLPIDGNRTAWLPLRKRNHGQATSRPATPSTSAPPSSSS